MSVLQHVSQATWLLSSPVMQASRTTSDTWPQNLSVVGVVADQESRASWASGMIICHCITVKFNYVITGSDLCGPDNQDRLAVILGSDLCGRVTRSL